MRRAHLVLVLTALGAASAVVASGCGGGRYHEPGQPIHVPAVESQDADADADSDSDSDADTDTDVDAEP